jgi:hypothetical protein
LAAMIARRRLTCVSSGGDAGGIGACASTAPVTCDPSSCKGCCEGVTCREGTSLTLCGTGGAACGACPLGAACTAGSCVLDATKCGPSNCYGCCDGNTCRAGTDQTSCGTMGGACENCVGKGPGACLRSDPYAGGTCASSESCGTISCPTGCCDRNYNCLSGCDNLACGSGGFCAVCSNGGVCAPSKGCTRGTCNVSNCSGCCDDFGVCHMSRDAQSCGADGSRCAHCPTGYLCDGMGMCAPP